LKSTKNRFRIPFCGILIDDWWMSMKKNKVFNFLVEAKRKFIENFKPKNMKNHDGKSFTRKRRLTIDRMLILILRGSPFSLQIRLDDFFKDIGHKEEIVSKQAFSKARTKIDPEVIKESFFQTTSTISQCEDLKLFKGKFRLCAMDGSDIVLDNAAELLDYFGGSGRNRDCATAMSSLCYDPLNGYILDAGLYPYGFSEREAAKNHFSAVAKLPIPKGVQNLYIGDRGYPSKELFAEMIDAGMYFFMRVRRKFNAEFDFDFPGLEKKVKFKYNNKSYTVRVFHIDLGTGEKETLVTNVPKKYISCFEAGELYFSRWKIETKFESLKNKLELENMSGRRVVTTYQDFWAKLDLANMLSALEFATNEKIEDNSSDKENIYEKITNENRMITKFTKRYIEMFVIKNIDDRLAVFDELVADIIKYPSEIKPDRNTPRKTPRKKKFHDTRKRVLC